MLRRLIRLHRGARSIAARVRSTAELAEYAVATCVVLVTLARSVQLCDEVASRPRPALVPS